MLGDFIGMRNDHALTDWHHYIHELLLDAMNQPPPMGGPKEIVEIDESFFAGRRKPAVNMHGRMLHGNQKDPPQDPKTLGMGTGKECTSLYNGMDDEVQFRILHPWQNNRYFLVDDYNIGQGMAIAELERWFFATFEF
uniref:Transposase n=1 Tax=Romanomermis culicivorax TaxID=13658 RepID=A0A915HIZ2_ROMCU